MKNKRILMFILAVVMIFSLTSCGAGNGEVTENENVKTFTDSLGREVEVPENIEKVAITGPLAQILVFSLCPDKIVGLASEWQEGSEEYLNEEYLSIPVIGALYGGKGEMNLETLLESGAQVVIDVGSEGPGVSEDMDNLQEQTGIPFVHISSSMETMGDSYRLLGDLVGMEKEAEVLANYCEDMYSRNVEIANSAEKKDILYITGSEGLNVLAKGSYHAEIIDLMTNNLAVVEEPSSKGTGNEVDLEQIMEWDPEVIIFAADSIYETVGDDPNWESLSAIENKSYYEAPMGVYNWMGFPPSVQRLLGMMWISELLYPEAVEYDLKEEVTEFYKLFFHCELTEEQYEDLISNSIGMR